MKKLTLAIVVLVLIFGVFSTMAFAEDNTATSTAASGTNITDNGSTADSTAVNGSGTDINTNDVKILPDSIIYPLKRILENIRLTLTFSNEGKAEYLVKMANKRLDEAKVMMDENKQDLIQKTMDSYIKAVDEINSRTEKAVQDDKDVTAILDDVKVVQDDAEQLAAKTQGVLSTDSQGKLAQNIEKQVEKTLVLTSLAESNKTLRDAKKNLKMANDELKKAKKTGDADKIQTAQNMLQQASQQEVNAEQGKNNAESLKKQVFAQLDSNNGGSEQGSVKTGEVKASQFAERQTSITDKQEQNRETVWESVYQHSGVAAAKIEANTEKHIAKKNETTDKISSKLAAQDRNSESENSGVESGTNNDENTVTNNDQTNITGKDENDDSNPTVNEDNASSKDKLNKDKNESSDLTENGDTANSNNDELNQEDNNASSSNAVDKGRQSGGKGSTKGGGHSKGQGR